MTDNRRHVLSVLIGLGLIACLLAIVSLDGVLNIDVPDTVTLREIQLNTPPPPPPPPSSKQDTTMEPTPNLQTARQQPQIELSSMDLNISLQAGEFGQGASSNWGEGIGIDWGTVSLSELDGVPTVTRNPNLNYPRELSNRGVRKVEVKLHILVDEQGEAYLINIVESSAPEVNSQMEEYVSDVRFTPPTLLGVPVKSEYLWPVVFQF